MAHGMSLKDASAFNVQFLGSRPVFVDTLVVQDRSDPASPPPVVAEPVAPVTSHRSGRKPDVYFLVLDAYGRSDVLKEVIGFDNSAFLDRLERKGFFVARRSTSIENAVDRILARAGASGRPIIIVQGDHGPGSRLESGSDRPNDIRERMSILNAIDLPEGGRELLDDAISPVNTCRIILDRYFGARLGRIADRNYDSAYGRPYEFTEVSAELAGASAGVR